MAHVHGGPGAPDAASPRVRQVLLAAVIAVVVATVVGMVLLRPSGTASDMADVLGNPDELVDGTVTATSDEPCPGSQDTGVVCTTIRVRLQSGVDEGDTITIEHSSGGGSPDIERGDRIVVGRVADLPADAPAGSAYYFSDFQRRASLSWLAVLFGVAVVALGRIRGIRALVALGISLVVLVEFVLPSILDGHSPVAVAVVGSSAVMLVALYLSHGFNVRTTTAALGTLVSLGITGVLAVVFVNATHLTGLASEEASYLQALSGAINIQGLLLGGIIIGSLGVLDDVTVTQASAVWELHQADPTMGFAKLYRAAVRIGRDHIASTVNTLVLAYAGASLPLLVLFTQSQTSLGTILSGEVIAVEVVRTLVGSIGLVASVPVTTALTALVVAADGPPAAAAVPDGVSG